MKFLVCPHARNTKFIFNHLNNSNNKQFMKELQVVKYLEKLHIIQDNSY